VSTDQERLLDSNIDQMSLQGPLGQIHFPGEDRIREDHGEEAQLPDISSSHPIGQESLALSMRDMEFDDSLVYMFKAGLLL
jgi:hypothetical protein